MNSHNEVMTACEIKAGAIAASAARQSGTTYQIDSIVGINRIHTRVSTVGSKDFFREAHYGALSIALGSMGGNVTRRSGYRTLMSRVEAADRKAGGFGKKGRNTGWRSPGQYRKKR